MIKKGSASYGTYQIHLSGIVQGVGFRPFIYNLANQLKFKGWVSNTSSGVYIRMNAIEDDVTLFIEEIKRKAPAKAKIVSTSFVNLALEDFKDFTISKSFKGESDERSITPDYAMCSLCEGEIMDSKNRRHEYAFTTCSECGPRYSIIDQLPYDRELTSMNSFNMCPDCLKEYENPTDRRFFSQTNSCTTCGVQLSLYSYKDGSITEDEDVLIQKVADAINEGLIVAVKGIGGYMLMADALNENSVRELRKRKKRPHKPFAVMLKDAGMLKEYADVNDYQINAFLNESAPIILTKTKSENKKLPENAIANHLGEIGFLRPYTPLHYLLLNKLNRPLIATSANLSGSPIIFEDDKIIEGMNGIADFILSHNRKIKAVQDDSVIRVTDSNKTIIIRRSRGLAPTFIRKKEKNKEAILAMGAMLKSTFTLLYKGNTLVSQYIGNSNSYETQECYLNTLQHLKKAMDFEEDTILIDKHPGYFTSELGEEMASNQQINLYAIQHHQAHFAAVLGENELWNDSVSGIVWDGTGYGDDNAIWGAEVFEYKQGKMKRVHHLPYHAHILGDKMVNEPRISALSFFAEIDEAEVLIKSKFTDMQWDLYKHLLKKSTLKTSSMGRLFDAVASILSITDICTFHGQAAMYLEAKAMSYKRTANTKAFPILSKEGDFDLTILLRSIVIDCLHSVEKEEIAYKFHLSLVNYIEWISNHTNNTKIAFSGGVFQNKLLIDLINEKLNSSYELYFHKELSPNDESISFGQLMHYIHISDNTL